VAAEAARKQAKQEAFGKDEGGRMKDEGDAELEEILEEWVARTGVVGNRVLSLRQVRGGLVWRWGGSEGAGEGAAGDVGAARV